MEKMNQLNCPDLNLFNETNNQTFFLYIYFEIQSTFKLIREIIVGFVFDFSSKLYVKYRNRPQWRVQTKSLLQCPQETLGYHLGCFLLTHKFELQPGCEDHDIFHILTGFKTDTASEIAMQYWLFGNGKRSPFLWLAMSAGVLYPDHLKNFITAYKLGLENNPIHQIDYQLHLSLPFNTFKSY